MRPSSLTAPSVAIIVPLLLKPAPPGPSCASLNDGHPCSSGTAPSLVSLIVPTATLSCGAVIAAVSELVHTVQASFVETLRICAFLQFPVPAAAAVPAGHTCSFVPTSRSCASASFPSVLARVNASHASFLRNRATMIFISAVDIVRKLYTILVCFS